MYGEGTLGLSTVKADALVYFRSLTERGGAFCTKYLIYLLS